MSEREAVSEPTMPLTMIPGMGFWSLLQYGIPVLIGGCLLASGRGERQRRVTPQPECDNVAGVIGRASEPAGIASDADGVDAVGCAQLGEGVGEVVADGGR